VTTLREAQALREEALALRAKFLGADRPEKLELLADIFTEDGLGEDDTFEAAMAKVIATLLRRAAGAYRQNPHNAGPYARELWRLTRTFEEEIRKEMAREERG
jgi:hypothetical protein